MSHRPAIDARGTNFRAFFAAGMACVLAVALLASSLIYGARAAASAQHAYAGAVISCHQDAVAANSEQGAPVHRGGHSNALVCPDCCLAGLAGAAVLPHRAASSADLLPIAASRAVYFVLSQRELEPAVSHSVNGARAPPAPNSLS